MGWILAVPSVLRRRHRGHTGVAISPEKTGSVVINGPLKPPRHVKVWDRASTQLRTIIEQIILYGSFISSDRKLMLASGWFEDTSAPADLSWVATSPMGHQETKTEATTRGRRRSPITSRPAVIGMHADHRAAAVIDCAAT
jgi:hypothetical protein